MKPVYKIANLKRHSRSRPDDVGVVELVVDVSVRPGGAVEVLAGHAQRRDQHGHAPQEEDGAADGEEATHQNEPEKEDVAWFSLPVCK